MPRIKESLQKDKTVKEDVSKKEFMPVLFNKIKNELPIGAVISGDFDITKINKDHPNYAPIVIQKGKEEQCYYIKSSTFEKYILRKNESSGKLSKINDEALENLHELKRAWLKFGVSILAVHRYRSYRLEAETFEEFCEKKLKLYQSTVYEIMKSTLFLMQEKPDTFEKILSGNLKAEDSLPSYRSLYLIAKKKKQLTKKGKFDELLGLLLSQQISTRDVQKKIAEILHTGKEKEISLEMVIKHYEKVCEEIEELKIQKEIINDSKKILNKLQELGAKNSERSEEKEK